MLPPDNAVTGGKLFPGWRGVRQAAGASVPFRGFRGAALNQSRSASGVYTGLVCCHGVLFHGSASCGGEKGGFGVTGEYAGSGDMTPPRSFAHYVRS